MAEPAAPAEADAALLPTAEALFAFLVGLRQAGYRIDARHFAAAEVLLENARTEGADGPAARRLKFRLAPAIAKSPTEQQDFYRRFDAWRGAPVRPSRIQPAGDLLREPAAGPAAAVVRRDPRRWVIAGAVAAFLALAAAATWHFWPLPVVRDVEPPPIETTPPRPAGKAYDLPPERFETTQAVVAPYYEGLKRTLAALPGFVVLTWFVLRWRRRLLWMSRGFAQGDAALASVPLPLKLAEVLFTGPAVRASAQDLRKHRYLPTRRLDARRTVYATARRAGLFTPVYRERPQLPEYVFLIEQNGQSDHLARLFDLAVERLRAEHVEIQRYYFHTDPRQLERDDVDRSLIGLSELAARTDDHRLFVIATADGFFHPLTGEVERWVERLEPWRSRTLLSTRPLEAWTVAELRLLEQGFSLATAEATGFAAAGQKVAFGDDTAELLEGVVVERLPRPEALPPWPAEPIVELPDLAVFRDGDAPWCPEMVVIPSGTFLMGSPEKEEGRYDDEGPQHKVTIGRRFAIGRTPVTVGEYRQFVEVTHHRHEGGMRVWTGSEWKDYASKSWQDPGFAQADRNPVVGVSWRDAVAYCEWLAKETGEAYRLPSEAEWEYAARAGTTTRYWWGDAITPKNANYVESKLGKTTEVGAYPPNPWGLYDLHGNVWEWVEDVWHDSYKGAPTDGSAWTEGEGKDSSRYRVYRGGSWGNFPGHLRSAIRFGFRPDGRISNLGFRVARTLS